jgi:HD-GYP domain-containing protein (c-di-GMP phosphodiesterase class II)
VRRAGLIHDIGKVDIQDRVLHKPGHLTADERQSLRTHTDQAIELGKKAPTLSQELPFGESAYHHENYDGTGYYGLKGDDIPLTSRILAVADTYDAITSDRPYRKGLPPAEALRRLKEAAGTQLEARLVEAFLRAHANGAIERVTREWYARAL